MKKFIFLYLIFSNILFSQSVWNWYLSYPTTNNYNCVKFINYYTGFISGECGTLLKSTNAGVNWTFIEINSLFAFTCVFPVNDSIIYSLTEGKSSGYGSHLYKSTNGGINWYIQKYFSSTYLRALQFFNSNTGYTCGDNGKIFFTTDGGSNWIDRSFNTQSSLQALYFVNNQVGYIASSSDSYSAGVFLKTTNGGLNWINMFNNHGYNITSLSFKDINNGVACGGSISYRPYVETLTEKIFKTSNGGLTWDTIIFNNGGIFRAMSSNNNNIFVFSEASSIKSSNFGMSWYNLGYTINPTPRYSCLVDSIKGYVVGDNGKIVKFSNNAVPLNLNTLFTTEPITSIYFTNANTGYMTTSVMLFGNLSYIYKTTNSGVNWNSCYLMGYEDTFKNIMFSNNYGIANGERVLLLTSNGGSNWIYYWYPTSFDINKSIILSNKKAFVVGDSNVLARSYNFGSWTAYPVSGAGHLKDIAFPDTSTGYIITDNNKYLKTTNSGDNWTVQIFPENNINCFHFLNSNTGFVFANHSLYKTSNGGSNWIQVVYNQNLYLIKLLFIDTIKGFGFDYYGNSFHSTTNGGLNWNPILLHYSGLLNNIPLCLHFTNSLTGYVTGYYGAIFRTTNGGIIWVNKIENKTPNAFSLSQNYPNPFNPNTIIRFQIKDSRFVTMKVYDILGKEIETLINEKKSPGTYEVIWDGSAYPSGVYFYKLMAGDFTETKKMLLIK